MWAIQNSLHRRDLRARIQRQDIYGNFHVYNICSSRYWCELIWVDRYVDLQQHMVEITYAFTARSWDESNSLISGVSKRTCENIFERLTICPFSMRVWSTAHHSTHHSLIWQYWDDARSHRRIDWPKKEGTGTPSIYQLYACFMTFNVVCICQPVCEPRIAIQFGLYILKTRIPPYWWWFASSSYFMCGV